MDVNKIIPNVYVYHKTKKKNRLSILENGLKISIGESYEYMGKKHAENITPAIFVNNTNEYDDGYCKGIDFDIFRINTQIINNVWFVDKYMEQNYTIDKYLITFENIPKHAIELIHLGKY